MKIFISQRAFDEKQLPVEMHDFVKHNNGVLEEVHQALINLSHAHRTLTAQLSVMHTELTATKAELSLLKKR